MKLEVEPDRQDYLATAATILLISTLFIYQPIQAIDLEGASMKPVLEDGDRVLCIKPVTGLEEGDIISFEHPDENISVMHRIDKRLNTSSYRTKGFNNPVRDPYIVHDNMINCRFVSKLERFS